MSLKCSGQPWKRCTHVKKICFVLSVFSHLSRSRALKMPHAPRSSASCGKVPTTLSAWTPLSHPLFNSKVTSTHLNTSVSLNHVVSAGFYL